MIKGYISHDQHRMSLSPNTIKSTYELIHVEKNHCQAPLNFWIDLLCLYSGISKDRLGQKVKKCIFVGYDE